MKIVLLETVGNLGITGDVVNVKPGYARNYLFPFGKAVVADSNNVRQVEHHKLVVEHRVKKAQKSAEETKKALEKEPLVLVRKTADGDRLFGSVTTLDIENAAKAKGFVISRKAITLEQPIKKTGTHKVPVKLEGNLTAQLTLEIQPENA